MIKGATGTYISAIDGSNYEGSWHNDKKHRKGGNIYEG